jgi:hypothetical protein
MVFQLGLNQHLFSKFTASVDKYWGAFPISNWPELLTHSRATCLESRHRRLARSNGRIENYDYYRKPGLLCFLRQNPNMTLIGSYHKAELYYNLYLDTSTTGNENPHLKNIDSLTRSIRMMPRSQLFFDKSFFSSLENQ